VNCRINIALIAFVCISTCSGFPQTFKKNMNLEFQSIKIPIGDPVNIAYLSASAGDSLLMQNTNHDITSQIGIPNLRPTYLLENGWVVHKKFVGGLGPLVFKEKDEFLRFKNWDYYLFGGPVFHPAPPTIAYSVFHLKPLAVEVLKTRHKWEEILGQRPDDKLLQAEDGSVIELAWPHFLSGYWYSSYEEYQRCLIATSD
jgi:hypothetical protein